MKSAIYARVSDQLGWLILDDSVKSAVERSDSAGQDAADIVIALGQDYPACAPFTDADWAGAIRPQ